jgi:superfamily I DNA/RNA helicase
MEGSWWRNRNELDDEQEAVIKLPADGRFFIVGPPGCGKTNLLVLRAAYLAKAKYKDLALLTYTNSLVDFIRSGVPQPIESHQVHTHIGWLRSIVFPRLPKDVVSEIKGIDEVIEQRKRLAEEFLRLSGNEDVGKLLQTAFVDEVQDFLGSELEAVVAASERVTIAGDARQSVYDGDALTVVDKLGFKRVSLTRHYRIGHAIAKVADRLIEPDSSDQSLFNTSHYDETKQASNADLVELNSRDEQFSEMLIKVRTQLKAFPKELIGVLVPKRDNIADLKSRFGKTDLNKLIAYHDDPSDVDLFSGPYRIHVMTIKASKGTEFRAAHLYACEDAQWPQVSRKFWYTAVTRARTSLTAYASPGQKPLNARLRAAFAEEIVPEIDSLFGDLA